MGTVACRIGDAMPLPNSAARIAASITDVTESDLWVRQYHAANAYDAATDGAFHHAYPRDEADRRYRAVVREYDAASHALISYRRARSAGTGV